MKAFVCRQSVVVIMTAEEAMLASTGLVKLHQDMVSSRIMTKRTDELLIDAVMEIELAITDIREQVMHGMQQEN